MKKKIVILVITILSLIYIGNPQKVEAKVNAGKYVFTEGSNWKVVWEFDGSSSKIVTIRDEVHKTKSKEQKAYIDNYDSLKTKFAEADKINYLVIKRSRLRGDYGYDVYGYYLLESAEAKRDKLKKNLRKSTQTVKILTLTSYTDKDGNKVSSSGDALDNTDVKSNMDCDAILGSTAEEDSVAYLLQKILDYIKVIGPLLVIVLSSIDFTKAIFLNDEDNMKKTQKRFFIRLGCAAALFLVPSLVEFVLDILGITTDAVCNLK